MRPSDLCYYLGLRSGFCTGVRVDARLDDPVLLDRELRRLGATHFYVDEGTPGRAATRLEGAGLGWTRMAPADRDASWRLLRAEGPSPG